MAGSKKVHQYTLNVPDELYKKLEEIARARGTTVAEVLRRGIKWEVLVDSVDKNGGQIFIRENADAELTQIIPF